MRVIYFFLIVVLFCSKGAYSKTNDSITIQGTFLRKSELLLGTVQQFGAKKHKIKVFKIKDGFFSFSLPSSIDPGVYRLQFDGFNEKPYVDLIVDGIEHIIVFDLNIWDFEAVPEFKESNENKNWYSYLKKTTSNLDRLNSLFKYLSDFHDESIDRLVKKTYTIEREKYYKSFSKFCADNKNTWAGLLVENRPYYFSNLTQEPVERDFIRSKCFWDDVDTSNLKLLNTPLYVELIDLYLRKYYINSIESYTGALKEYHLKQGIDVLIDKFSNNSNSEAFIRSYLEDYFESLKMQDMVDYVRKK